MNRKKRYLFFDDMELYQKVLNDLAKQGVTFVVGKTGCHVMTQEQLEKTRTEGLQGRSSGATHRF